jgi:Ran GTPase-activating protein (RanGAP) involved in mRNA processing and transport
MSQDVDVLMHQPAQDVLMHQPTQMDVLMHQPAQDVLIHQPTQDVLTVFANERVLDLNRMKPDLVTLCRALLINTYWHTLILSENDIESKDVAQLCKAMQNNTTLTKINLRHNRIDHKGLQTIFDFIVHMLDVHGVGTHVLCDHNPFGDDGVKVLANQDKGNISIMNLSLMDCRITAAGVAVLTQSTKFKHITELDLSDNAIGDEGVSMIAKAQRQHDQSYVIRLARCRCTHRSMLDMADCVRRWNIEELELNDNPIGDVGVAALSGAIGTNRSLRYLELARVGMTDVGAEVLSTALRIHPQMMKVTIRGNAIKDETCAWLARQLVNNDSLVQVHATVTPRLGTGWEQVSRHCGNVVTRKVSWIQICLLIASMRACQGQPLANSIQLLIPLILGYEYSGCVLTRVRLERYMDTKHYASQINVVSDVTTSPQMDATSSPQMDDTSSPQMDDNSQMTATTTQMDATSQASAPHTGKKRKTMST